MGSNVLYANGYEARAVNPNLADLCLNSEISLWSELQRFGGVEKVCCPGLKYTLGQPPWVTMPPEGRRFQEIETVALPPVGTAGTDQIVLQRRVPVGYDGVTVSVVNEWSSGGFAEGSGTIRWRIQLNRRWVPDYGDITTTLGSLTSPSQIYRGGIRIYSDQLMTYYVNISPAGYGVLDPNGRIICALIGWYYPR